LKLHEQRDRHWNAITGYGPGYIEINGVRHAGNLILATASVQRWDVSGFDQLRPEDFEPVLQSSPELVLLGTGLRHRAVHPLLTAFLARAGVGLEVMDTRAACRTFNILAGDGRRVVGAMLQEEEKA